MNHDHFCWEMYPLEALQKSRSADLQLINLDFFDLSRAVNSHHFLSSICQVYIVSMSPTHNRSSVLQPFECGNAVEMLNRIIFDFYPALPHVIGIHGV